MGKISGGPPSVKTFFTGTAADITQIHSVDKAPIGVGGRGPITELMQNKCFPISEDSEDD